MVDIKEAKSQAYKITMNDGTEYVGFILENGGVFENAMVVLLYSSIHDNVPQKIADTPSGTDWRVLFYSDIESVTPNVSE